MSVCILHTYVICVCAHIYIYIHNLFGNLRGNFLLSKHFKEKA